MATLPAEDIDAIWADLMALASRAREPLAGLEAEDIRAAVAAADAWADANAASFNAALPQPARGALSAPHKVLMLSRVMDRRYGRGV